MLHVWNLYVHEAKKMHSIHMGYISIAQSIEYGMFKQISDVVKSQYSVYSRMIIYICTCMYIYIYTHVLKYVCEYIYIYIYYKNVCICIWAITFF